MPPMQGKRDAQGARKHDAPGRLNRRANAVRAGASRCGETLLP